MNKYNETKITDAIYNKELTGNPFLDAMPSMIPSNEFMKLIGNSPSIPFDVEEHSAMRRRQFVMELNKLFVPLDYMYYIYDLLYRAIIANYSTQKVIDDVRQINAFYKNDKSLINSDYATQSYSGTILGVPGIGKTSTIRRCLNLIPQVIIHKKYNRNIFYYKQITHLVVECPSDCSIKALTLNIFAAVDNAIGSNYFDEATSASRLSASALAIKVKIICLNHHVGVLVIDEIQNAVTSAAQNRQTTPLIKFLVELTNETCLSICFSGTTLAEELFLTQEHLKRRTRGMRLLPMKPDITYKHFVERMWQYQMTLQKVKLTQDMENLIYQHSAGIPSYIIKIFQEAQIEAIISGKETITKELIKKVIIMQSIEVPKLFKSGISISSFSLDVGDTELDDGFIKTKRGRKTIMRECADIIVLYNSSSDSNSFMRFLIKQNLLEIIKYRRD